VATLPPQVLFYYFIIIQQPNFNWDETVLVQAMVSKATIKRIEILFQGKGKGKLPELWWVLLAFANKVDHCYCTQYKHCLYVSSVLSSPPFLLTFDIVFVGVLIHLGGWNVQAISFCDIKSVDQLHHQY